MAKQKENKKNKDSKEELSEVEKSNLIQDPPPTIFAWIIRGVSLLLVLVLFGYFSWSGFQPEDDPTFAFKVMREDIKLRDHGWVIPVEIENLGDKSVQNLHVSASLSGGGPDKEQEEIQVLLLGPGESITTDFWFDENPQDREVEFNVGTYIIP